MENPFNLSNGAAYDAWREQKLSPRPLTADDLIVKVVDPHNLSTSEYHALCERLGRYNMAIYHGPAQSGNDELLPMELGRRFGLRRFDRNYLAEGSGVSAISVGEEGVKPQFIPYTSRALKWHTDGYYNSADDPIRAFILHCANDAAMGGENRLLDHEIAYIRLRDKDPDYVRALMHPVAMTIPAREDEEGIARPDVSGPVFVTEEIPSRLYMRYSARTRNIVWRDDAITREALSFLSWLLEEEKTHIVHVRLEPGMGLVCNNVLHDRSTFRDTREHGKRLLYRVRYFDAIEGSGT